MTSEGHATCRYARLNAGLIDLRSVVGVGLTPDLKSVVVHQGFGGSHVYGSDDADAEVSGLSDQLRLFWKERDLEEEQEAEVDDDDEEGESSSCCSSSCS